MTAELTTAVGQLSISHGKWRQQAPNQVAVRQPQSADAPGVGKGDLYIVTEIRGTAGDTDTLEQKLAQAIRDSYYLSRGSVTASLRRAIQTGNELLFKHNQQVKPEAHLLGGAVVLVMCQEDTFVAHTGPAAFFAVLGDHIQRYPVKSPWLDEALAPGPDQDAPALGQRQVIEPNLHHLNVSPHDMLVLADSRLASQLPLRDLVQAVATRNVKTAVKNLGKIARASHCSALAVEILEDAKTSIGPLKISAPRQLGGFLNRNRSRSTPNVAEAEPQFYEAANDETTPNPYATFIDSSTLKKPLGWLGMLSRKSQPEPSTQESSYFDDDLAGDDDLPYNYPAESDEEAVYEPPLRSRVMASMAPESTFGHSHHRQQHSAFSVSKVFGWVGAGLLMVIALIANGLKTILHLVLPNSTNQPRQAGLQASRQPPSAATWKLLRNVAIAIPILVGLIVLVNYLQKGRIREAEYQEFVATAQSKFEQAQSINDVPAALSLMSEAEAALVQAEQIKETQPEIEELRQQMAAEADRLGNVQRLVHIPQLRQYTDPGTNLSRLVAQGVELYVLDSGNDRIYHHRLDDTTENLLPDDDSVVMVGRGQTVENVTVGDMLDMTWMPTGGNRQTSDLIILNSTGLLEYNPNWGITTSALAGGETLALPNAVDSFFGNFYVLDAPGNRLWRYRPTADGYSAPPESYFTDDQAVDLSGAVDLAIDGAIYILYQDGRIAKYLSSQPQEFNLTGLDLPLSNPLSIFTAPSEEAQHLYIADAGNQRIVQLNKDGSFVRQFKPHPSEGVSFANLQDIFVDEIGSRIYILANNNLYVTNIPAE